MSDAGQHRRDGVNPSVSSPVRQFSDMLHDSILGVPPVSTQRRIPVGRELQ